MIENILPTGSYIKHKINGNGRIVDHQDPFYLIRFKAGLIQVPYIYKEMSLIEDQEDLETKKLKQALRDVLTGYSWIDEDLELGSKWSGGSIIIKSADSSIKDKEIPITNFFKKIISVREKLRVLEQKINNNKNLSLEEKLEYESLITKCYGSLTTFNILFKNKESHFIGSSSS